MDNHERVLDWQSFHDPHSRSYGIAEVVGSVEPVKKYWSPGVVLDQGREGACVGFGWTSEGLASPMPFTTTAEYANPWASGVYHRCKEIDGAPPGTSGTSVLAGAKVMVERGYIADYRWSFAVEELRSAVISEGPAVLGINWYENMYETKPNGLVDIGGKHVGGHCIIVTGYNPRARLTGLKGLHEVFRWKNSWGTDYGLNGQGFIKIEDLDSLLKDNGEACIPQHRTKFRF